MGYGEELKITKTYRNAQEVIDIAGRFVQRNDSQIKKSLISPKHIQKPVIIQTYSEEYDRKQYKGKGGKFFHLGKQVEDIIGRILEQNKREGKSTNSSILLNRPINRIEELMLLPSLLFCSKILPIMSSTCFPK